MSSRRHLILVVYYSREKFAMNTVNAERRAECEAPDISLGPMSRRRYENRERRRQ